MVIKIGDNPRYDEYNQYLESHISNVKRAWNEILMPCLLTESDFTVETLTRIALQIDYHDQSKYSDEEYDAYLEYFYPADGSNRDFNNVPDDISENFDKAWLHHQKNNSHHWQYWVLVRDEGELVPMDMSLESVLEMLCDWSSFQYTKPGSTANSWYHENKDKMILSDRTRDLVEEYLELCPEL